MNQFPLNLFEPTQDWSLILPVLLVLLVILATLLLIWWAFEYIRQKQAQQKESEEFMALAKSRGLERRQIQLLKTLVKKFRIHPMSRILTEQDRFERAILSSVKDFQSMMIQDMREKLFGNTIQPTEPIHTTRQLIPGTRLFLQYSDKKNTAIWGHLVDIDPVGLVVVIPSYREVKIPLRPKTRLNVWAFSQGHFPIQFSTEVLSVIPGPRKMVVLEHSNFAMQKDSSKVPYSYPFPQKHEQGAMMRMAGKENSSSFFS